MSRLASCPPDCARRCAGNRGSHHCSTSVSRRTSNVELTPSKRRVLRLITRGTTVAEVASTVGISANTVKSQLKRAYERLDVHSRVAAAEQARRLGLLVDIE
ncbi:response regulator transcription factor [Gemmatimonas sp.]|uniref:response regulator transcription factor n=1 Tax=Gemmatimonas sp. TaxID=1962908 RepID=UPI0039830257